MGKESERGTDISYHIYSSAQTFFKTKWHRQEAALSNYPRVHPRNFDVMKKVFLIDYTGKRISVVSRDREINRLRGIALIFALEP